MPGSPDSGAPTMFKTHCNEMCEALVEGFCIIEVIFEGDQPTDYRFLEVNRAFIEQTGLEHAEAKTMRSLAPNHEAH